MDIDTNDRLRGMTDAQQAVFDTASGVLEQWVKTVMEQALGIEMDGCEVPAHEQAFWLVYFAMIEQAAKLAALAEPRKGSSDAVRKLTIDFRRALERHFGVSGVSLSSPATTPRMPSETDTVVPVRMRAANLAVLERGLVLGRDALGADIGLRLVREDDAWVLEVTGPETSHHDVPDPVDVQQIEAAEPEPSGDLVRCSQCGDDVPLSETLTRKTPVSDGRWSGFSTRLVCLPCARKQALADGDRG